MALQIEANYSKKIGLPGYSSHQFSITLKAELSDISQVEAESSRLYALLQSSVDREIQKTGYLPSPQSEPVQTSNGHQNESMHGNGYHRPQQQHGQRNVRIGIRPEQWKCSPKQQELILRIVRENGGDKDRVEQLSQELFGVGVKQLNKLQASGLIDELLQHQGNQAEGGRQ